MSLFFFIMGHLPSAMVQTDSHQDRHGDSMTESAQWGRQFLNLDFVTKYQTHVIKLTEAADHTEGSLVTSRVVLPPSPSHPQGRPVSPVGHV